jgi:hypothetical protein
MNGNIEDIIVDAKTLQSNNAHKRCIYDYLEQILLTINKDIKGAKLMGQNYVITELPTIYDIPNTCNSDSQRTIWARTIEILKKKNYRVYINHTKDSCLLKIGWLPPEEERKIALERRIINESSSNF